MNEENPFERFIVDENATLDKELIVNMVEPFLETIGRNKIIKYTEKFESSSWQIKVAIYLCIRKIMLEYEIIKEEQAGPKEISEDTRLNENTVKMISRDELLKKFVSNDNGKYYIKNYDIKKLKKMLEENG